MQGAEKSSTIYHFLVLAGLWFINILIMIFGSPFLIYKKIRAIFSKRSQPIIKQNSNSARYFPHRIDSEL